MYIFQELSNSLYSESLLIIRDVVRVTVKDLRIGKEMMMFLLDKQGAEIVITEEIVNAPA